VAKLVPYTARYVRKLLPSKYKHAERSNINDAKLVPHHGRIIEGNIIFRGEHLLKKKDLEISKITLKRQ